jgi:plastocyanin
MKRRHRIGALVAVLLVLAPACNSKLIRPPAIVFVDGGEARIRTTVQDIRYAFPSVFFAFLPSRVPLHPGDALNFSVRDTGEPHTVALGRLVDKGLLSFEALGATTDIRQIESLPGMKKLPGLFPGVVRGAVPQINRSASEPCFITKGSPPTGDQGGAKACEETEQPEFDGKQDFFSSGVIEEGEPFRVKLAGDISLGSYRFMCLMHRASMTGVVDVVDPETDRPAVAQLRREADDEQQGVVSSLEVTARAAVRREGGPILAGTGPRGTARGLVSGFIPRERTTRVDRPLGWRFYRMHSISFRPSREAKEGLLVEEDGELTINEDSWKPVGSERAPRAVFNYPAKPDAYSVDGGTWDGEGTFSSGVLRATPPASVSFTMRFSKAGTYPYYCLVHPAMRGTITVEE